MLRIRFLIGSAAVRDKEVCIVTEVYIVTVQQIDSAPRRNVERIVSAVLEVGRQRFVRSRVRRKIEKRWTIRKSDSRALKKRGGGCVF